MKLTNVIPVSGVIHILSGLHIGAGKDTMEIGGLDQPIIKHPITKEPYIPGSSIKGKMRALLELYYFINNAATREYLSGKHDKRGIGRPCGCGKRDCPACVIFGAASDKKDVNTGPTRLIVRDAVLSAEDKMHFENGDLRMEVKYENSIDRVKGIAQDPRPLERVPAGVRFDFSLSFKVFEGDDPRLIEHVYKGLRLIELDALGGCGSRGCGQVRFENLACDGQPVNLNDYPLK
ncbi:type III-A CRISPR-associated RAMP protein Csm3 [Desulfolutivibrio sulfoxidireducens]|uniref:type III-A CRISPR-associated RAMP protein Csm3 n=1 Tax=Desulfolutivibrio sulfoxidireducens TaxID=2773299 RepID=UPI00159E0A48|nr:type III-A CRISPR-associated RAMP protein Csm3 [Desulfolutivibrio sulfoxidireducens]QLA19332.1 type III-A CRISPR-associated RAMP protein Csm3 [Desulfolutivibrio sulfoxidireducens]